MSSFSEAIAQLGLSDKIDKKYKVEAVASTHHTSSHSKAEYKICEVPLPSVGLALALFIPLLLLRRHK